MPRNAGLSRLDAVLIERVRDDGCDDDHVLPAGVVFLNCLVGFGVIPVSSATMVVLSWKRSLGLTLVALNVEVATGNGGKVFTVWTNFRRRRKGGVEKGAAVVLGAGTKVSLRRTVAA